VGTENKRKSTAKGAPSEKSKLTSVDTGNGKRTPAAQQSHEATNSAKGKGGRHETNETKIEGAGETLLTTNDLPRIRELAANCYDNWQPVYGALKVSRVTLWRFIKQLPPETQEELHELKRQSREAVTDIAQQKHLELIQAGYWPAIKYELDTQGRERGYGQHVQVQDVTNYADMLCNEDPGEE